MTTDTDFLAELLNDPRTEEEIAREKAEADAEMAAKDLEAQRRWNALPASQRPLSESELHALLSIPINQGTLARASIFHGERIKCENLRANLAAVA